MVSNIHLPRNKQSQLLLKMLRNSCGNPIGIPKRKFRWVRPIFLLCTYILIFYFYLLQVTDLPQEDLLSHFTGSNAFIQEGLAKDGAVLVHCYRGRSRSATVVVAFLMQKHGYSAERALAKVRSKREIIQPHDSFLAQLRLYESMEFSIDPENLQFKMFK